MADYTTITDSQVDPEAPITSELMSALRDNPIAIAEGAANAPRVEASGRKFEALARQSATGTTAIGWTSLETDWLIQFFIRGNAPETTSNLQVRASSNNGSTWSSYATIITSPALSDQIPATFNTKTGVLTWAGGVVSTGVTNANGVQFRMSASGVDPATIAAFGYPVSRGEV